MFIELNNLKGLIVNLDSFKQETDIEWSNISDKVKLLFFSNDKTRLINISSIRNNVYTSDNDPYAYFINTTCFAEFLKIMSLHSYEVVFVSSDIDNIKNALNLPLGTILVSDTNVTDYTRICYLPDFEVSKIDEINDIINDNINGKMSGYFAELATTIFKWGEYLPFNHAYAVISEKELNGYKCSIVCGGRYFNTHDERYKVHQLSQRIINNKDTMSQNAVFLPVFEQLVKFVDSELSKVDGVTRVPPRPSEIKNDRFLNIIGQICDKNGYTDLAHGIYCNSDYPTQKNLNAEERLENVRGKFSARMRFDGMHVILIDDVISTGATAFECAKVLYENGAKKVTILVLGVNQLTNSWRSTYYKDLRCEYCGALMKMRFNSKRLERPAFFGCTNYRNGNCSNTVDYITGIRTINEQSEISTLTVADSNSDIDLLF
ncbi:MAG TPA: ComF family protein [Clostridiales bacterium]|jgi:hypothetical protein|nr:ComF family protein [Clostridiales bacterium]